MIGIGAGQQSRVDCTKLAGAKADVWQLGLHPKVLGLDFKPEAKRQERINWRIRYIEGGLTRYESDALADALARPAEPLTSAEKADYLSTLTGVSLASDGFIPFRDNIDHASRHGVRFIAERRLDEGFGHRGRVPRIRHRARLHESAPLPSLIGSWKATSRRAAPSFTSRERPAVRLTFARHFGGRNFGTSRYPWRSFVRRPSRASGRRDAFVLDRVLMRE
jgi:hypothetical protein